MARWRRWGSRPAAKWKRVLAEATLALVLFSDASRVGLHQLRADLGLCLWLLGIGLPLAIGLGTLLAFILPGGERHLARLAHRRGARAD
jgi:sodium/hydrogen antiporter